ncbi:MAG: HPr family phosphocarrier protein [Gammaproteobacteria bacterium]|nr:HPr family phosphocarrier protein [Gammaproteobacteria bacterium]
MPSEKIEIVNKLGLHARAAAKLVQIASGFNSDVSIRFNGKEADGKSIMGIMMLAASKGNTIELTVSGPDEDESLAAIKTIISNKFDEPE